MFGPPGGFPRASWLLKTSWGVLGPIGASWGSRSCSGAVLGHLGGFLECLVPFVGRPGALHGGLLG
eukprot:7436319-Pyramimonas_sp.AAC.1